MTADHTPDLPEHSWADKQHAAVFILAALRDRAAEDMMRTVDGFVTNGLGHRVDSESSEVLSSFSGRLQHISAAIVDVVLLVCPELRERGAQLQQALLNYADMGATEAAEGGWDIDPEPPRWTELFDE